MRLIGLTGRAGCGKNTVGDMLSMLPEGNGMPFELLAFAAPLKEMLDGLLDYLGEDYIDVGDWDAREWKESPLKSIGVSPRRLAQTLGTEWGREMIHPDIWLKCAGHSVALLAEEEGVEHICFTDCRFENEASWIRGQGGEVWHILRPGIEPVEAHKSESGIVLVTSVDSVVDNTGDLDALAYNVIRALHGQLKVEPQKGAA